MKKSKAAFTLAEILIAMVVVGLIAIATIPAIVRRLPNKEEETHKKVTYLVEQIVSQMIANEAMYPQNQAFSEQGFKNLNPVIIKGIEYSGEDKFCQLFAAQFDKKAGSVVCTEAGDSDTNSFISGDNIAWYIPTTDFQDGYTQIIVDINPDNNKHEWDKDTFRYFIRLNGVVIGTNNSASPTMPATDPDKPFSISVEESCNQADICEDNCEKTYQECKSDCSTEAECNTCKTTLNTCKSNCMSVCRSAQPHCWQIKENGSLGTSSCSNLGTGDYQVIVYPRNNFYSNWLDNKKNIKITGKKVNVVTRVRYTQFETHSITLNINDCDNADDPTACATYKIQKYKFTALVEGDVDEYGNILTGDVTGYKREIDTSFGNKSMTVVKDENGQKLPKVRLSNLQAGDYLLTVTPKSGYRIDPEPTSGTAYKQEIKLGTKDVEFTTTVTK